jgi:hypothetical protein
MARLDMLMKLLNFRIDGVKLEVGGQVFDLHNHFKLHGYAHETANRVFTLNLRGHTYHFGTTVETQVKTELRFTFRNVIRLHIKDLPFDPTNVCYLGMATGSEIPSHLVERLEEEARQTDGEEPIDWNACVFINFIWGVDILVSAETAEVCFRQSASADGS